MTTTRGAGERATDPSAAWSQWHARYWREERHGVAWEKARLALRRDWALEGYLPEAGKALLRSRSPWHQAETAIRYGFGAREEYGPLPWNEALEHTLALEWDAVHAGRSFNEVRELVRHGFGGGMPARVVETEMRVSGLRPCCTPR